MVNIPNTHNFEQYKDSIIRVLLWVLLISSLIATITNLAWAFSVVSPLGSRAAWFGAVSFDGAVLIISFYARRFADGSYPRRLARAIVITNTVISIYANVYRAIEFQRELVRISGAAWNSMPLVLGFALPLLTWALAEVLVSDETQRSNEFEREQKKAAKQAGRESGRTGPEAGQASGQAGPETGPEAGQASGQTGPEAGQISGRTRQISRAERIELVIEAVAQGKRSRADIVEYTGIPRGSVNRLMTELYGLGQLIKNQSGQPELPNQTGYNQPNGPDDTQSGQPEWPNPTETDRANGPDNIQEEESNHEH